MNNVNYVATSSFSRYIMKQNVNLFTLISKTYRSKIVNTLFKVKLQALTIQLAALRKSNFPYTFNWWIYSGVDNLWIGPEPSVASQDHPEPDRATQESLRASQNHSRVTQSQLKPVRAS